MRPVFETKNGTVLYEAGETFYTTDKDDVYQAINEDLQSDDLTDVAFAKGLVQLLDKYGCVDIRKCVKV